jgi:hypothetical protein
MTKAANENRPLLDRHPRLLTPAHDRGCNRDRKPKDNREEDGDEDTDREFAAIERRIKFLNWIEWSLRQPKKRTIANDNRQVWLAERNASNRIS